MILTNEELKKIYFGAYEFEEKDGYLKANQYSKPQMDYFNSAFEMWAERCDASTAKTFEFTTDASEVSFDYFVASQRVDGKLVLPEAIQVLQQKPAS